MTITREAAPTLQEPSTIASFFSSLQLRRLRRNHSNRTIEAPIAEAHHGAFMFLDMVSFTSLGEQLGAQGIKGAEVLSDVLHAYYRPILATIRAHGGDVVFFAGDGIGAVWLADGETPEEAAVRAGQCGVMIQRIVPTISSAWPEPLAFRVSLGVGKIETYEVGGVAENWMQLVKGEAVDQACLADRHGGGGQVVMPASCATYLQRYGADLVPLTDGFVRLNDIKEPVTRAALPTVEVPADQDAALRARLSESVHRLLYYPDSAVAAEFRRITVVFVDISADDPRTLHAAVQTAQQEVSHLDGAVYQLIEDDKGTKLICVFGLPGASHADDHLRALLLAKQVSAAHTALGLSPRVGIASGTAFCGTLGSAERQQYSIIGSAINLAARLMTLAEPGQTYCDLQTRKLADAVVEFEQADWTTPKGFQEPVPIFRPGARKERVAAMPEQNRIVGRDAELSQIAEEIDAVKATGASRLLVLRADAGLGKSAVLEAAGGLVSAKGLLPITSATDAFETGTAYFAFRSIARVWAGIRSEDTTAIATEKLSRALQNAPDLMPLVPLLGPVIGFDIPETTLTDGLRGQVRSENTQRVLLYIASAALERQPSVLLIEDAHWMDGASWAFLAHLLENVPAVLVLLSSRPAMEGAVEASPLLEAPDTQVINLQPLSRAETEAVICQQLDISDLGETALDLVHGRAEGNPLFIREIVRNLMETGDVQVRESGLHLLKRSSDAEPVPDTLDGVITSRIDRLEADPQITLKAAAVLGRSFDADLLLAVHPLSVNQDFLDAQLDVLKESGFLVPQKHSGGFEFYHALARDAAYNLLSFAQRESLHHKTAQTLEAAHVGQSEQIHARLGYHFRMAGIKDKAAPYLASAGATALDAYASIDAIELLTSALQLDEEHRGADIGPDLSRAKWCKLMGQAHYNQDDQAEAGNWYRRGIEAAGAAPGNPLLSAVPTLMRALFAPGSLDRHSPAALTEEDRERITHGMASARELGTVYLWESAVNKFLMNTVNLARMARMVGPTDETANAVVTLSFMLCFAGLRKQSEKLALQAVRMAQDFGDPEQLMRVRVVAGMVLTQNGSAMRGLPLFEAAEDRANDLVAGIWRHRCKYMLADAYTWLGRYAEAHRLFLQSAALSHSAEPHAVGQATAMAALNLLRMGQPDEAVALLEGPDGVPHALDCGVPASAIMALGVLAETRMALGQKEAALAAAAQAEAQTTEKDDGTGYYSGLFGYSAILSVRLQAGELGTATTKGSRSAVHEDLKKLNKLKGIAPLGRATHALWHGVFEALQGRTKKAEALLKTAVHTATEGQQPYVMGRSLMELARLSEGDARQDYIAQAIDVFERHQMPLELARARALAPA